MRVPRFLLLVLAVPAIAACDALAQFQPAPPIVQMEVWNQTLDDVFLIDADGRLISVPACGHADPAPLAVELVELRMDAGRISTFSSTGIFGERQYLIVVAEDGFSFPTNHAPAALPPCQGHPNAVP